MDTNLNYLLTRTVSTVVKLGVCALAPYASTKLFQGGGDGYADVLREASGISNPKLQAFIGCAVNILAQDVVDAAEWVANNDISSKVSDYFSPDMSKYPTNQAAFNDTYVEDASNHLHNDSSYLHFGE
jgi:hypothetical protein